MTKHPFGKLAAILGLLMFGMTGHAAADDISGAGATFPYPVYSKWAEAYKKETGIGLNYQSIGSGGGIKQIKAQTVTFGASDMPLKPDELEEAGLMQWPMIIGGVVPVMNIKGIAAGDMALDSPTLASIYLGDIKSWDDPRIAALNPKIKLPHMAIAPVYRSDGSGTTFLFTHYLSETNPKFAQTIGDNASVQWPQGIGAKGNEGVANVVGQTDGAIGYVEYAYVMQNKLNYARMTNKEGKMVKPSAAAFQAAAATADWAAARNYYLILTNQPGANSWPITGASFILMYKNPVDAKASDQALKFFSWAYAKGGKMAQELDYVPVPDSVVALVRNTWAEMGQKQDTAAVGK
jgi:phosphate transport system substrate-binding protein